MTDGEKLDWAISFCRRAQLRPTGTREKILRFLSGHRLPVSIEMMARPENLGSHCAETTIYRTLLLFREVDLVRQINLPGKTSYFILNVPGGPCDFLVCRCCGRVEEVPLPKAMSRIEQEVAAQSGFSAVFHELELYGICPVCQTVRQEDIPATKLAGLHRRFSRAAPSR